MPKRLLYFGPLNVTYPDAIRSLANDERLIELINTADACVTHQLGWSPLDRIKGSQLSPKVSTFEDCLVSECLYQLCVFEKLRSLDIDYHYVSALSLGEIVAAYASGMHSFEDTILICCAVAEVLREPKHTDSLMVFASDDRVAEFVKLYSWKCHLAMQARICSIWAGTLPEVIKLQDFLTSQGLETYRLFINSAPHTPLINTASLKSRLQSCTFLPTDKPYFSTIVGGLVKDTTDASFWERLVSETSLLTPTLDALSHLDCDQIIRIGTTQFERDLQAMLADSGHPAKIITASKILGHA